MPISVRRSVYDWTVIILLLAASTVGRSGAVRLWSICPLMLLVSWRG